MLKSWFRFAERTSGHAHLQSRVFAATHDCPHHLFFVTPHRSPGVHSFTPHAFLVHHGKEWRFWVHRGHSGHS